MVKCHNCGSLQEDQALFCDACGNSLQPFSPAPESSLQPSAPAPESDLKQASSPAPESSLQPSAPATESKIKTSRLCLAGLICSLLSVAGAVLTICTWKVYWNEYESSGGTFFGLLVAGYIITLVGFLAGLVISIVGTARAKKFKLKGRGFGVAGIIISALMGAVSIAVTVLIVLAAALLAAIVPSVKTWPDHLRSFEGEKEKFEDYEVILSNDGERALITTWFWSGDPDDTVITIPDRTHYGVMISSVGGEGKGPLPPEFRIELEDKKSDYRQTDSFKNSRAAQCSSSRVETNPAYYGIPSDMEVHYGTLLFTIELGENVDYVHCDICDRYLIFVNDDGSITFYTYDYYYVCDPDNPVYYTVDGKLFEREEDD